MPQDAALVPPRRKVLADLPVALLVRLEALAGRLSSRAGGARVSRAEALRVALEAGVGVLESPAGGAGRGAVAAERLVADPESLAEVDLKTERTAFETAHKATPEVWLARWRGGGVAHTGENLAVAYRAKLLETS